MEMIAPPVAAEYFCKNVTFGREQKEPGDFKLSEWAPGRDIAIDCELRPPCLTSIDVSECHWDLSDDVR